jgi:hypothetical protein
MKLVDSEKHRNLHRTDRGQIFGVHRQFLDCPEIKLTSSYFHHSWCNHRDYLVIVQEDNKVNEKRIAIIKIPSSNYPTKNNFSFLRFLFARGNMMILI